MTEDKQKAVEDILSGMGLSPGEPHDCSYIKGLKAREVAFKAEFLPPGVYQHLMNLGFRRSGRVFYKPVCADCNECRPIRIPVQEFKPNRSQKRIIKLNEDLKIKIGDPTPTKEKFELYKKYILSRHLDKPMSVEYEDFIFFLYESSLDTLEVEYWAGNQLLGCGILDCEPYSVSAVYFYYDTEQAKRSLGTYNILWGINYCLEYNLPYYYLGYYVSSCNKMNYKTNFKPCEILLEKNEWEKIL